MKKRLFSALLAGACTLSLGSSALALEAQPTGHAAYWTGDVYMEGHRANFAQNGKAYQPINYNGNVYVPLFAVGEWTASDVQWNESAKQISVTYSSLAPTYYRTAGEVPAFTDESLAALQAGRTTGFDVTVLTDVTVTGDSGTVSTASAQGAPLYPIVYEDIPYLSVRTVAQLTDKTQAFVATPHPNLTTYAIYLYAKPTQAQIDAARAYLDELDAGLVELDTRAQALNRTQTTQELHDGLAAVKDQLLKLKEASIPSIPTLTFEVTNSLYWEIDGDNGLRALNPDIAWAANPNSLNKELRRVRDLHAANVSNFATHTLPNVSTRMRQIVDAMASGELR